MSESEGIAAADSPVADRDVDRAMDAEDRLRPEFVDRVLDAVDAGDDVTARALVEPLHPADVADLIELAARDERDGLVRALAEIVDADVLAEMNEHVREALLDADEGADWLMVKPALPYLDVIRAVREASRLPLSAYNVSGEYSAVKAAAANGWLDEARIVRENLLAIRRAGADQIITYHARDALRGKWL